MWSDGCAVPTKNCFGGWGHHTDRKYDRILAGASQ
jgi:hypothetical protein